MAQIMVMFVELMVKPNVDGLFLFARVHYSLKCPTCGSTGLDGI